MATRGPGRWEVPGEGAPTTGDDGPLAVMRSAAAAAGRRKLPLAAWIVGCLAAAAAYAHSLPPTYTATASILLDPQRSGPSQAGDAGNGGAPALDSAQAESQLQVIRSERLLTNVFDGLGLAGLPELMTGPPGPLGRLKGVVGGLLGQVPGRSPTAEEARELAFANFVNHVSARRVGLSYVVEVSYVSGDPTLARRATNATVSAYLGQSVTFKADAAANGAEFLQGRVNALKAEAAAAAAGVAAGTLPTAPTPDADARVIGAALQPLGRSGPRTGLIVAFGGVLGAFTGLLAVALGAALDGRIRTPEALARAVGAPCLGVVPRLGGRGGSRPRKGVAGYDVVLSRPDGGFAASLRDIRAAAFPSGGGEGTALAFVAPCRGAGTTTLCANLARAVASSGREVTLVDCDVHRRNGGLTGTMLPVKVGLADALIDEGLVGGLASVRSDDVRQVPARSGIGNGTRRAFLGSSAMATIIRDAREFGDVILDLPAISTTGDARSAAAMADGVILVACADATTHDEVRSAVDALRAAGCVVVGAVLNRVRG